jgi:hypothetical protein
MWEILLGAVIGLMIAGLGGALAGAVTAVVVGWMKSRKIVIQSAGAKA